MAAVAETVDGMEMHVAARHQGPRPLYLAHLTLIHLAPPQFVSVAAEAGYDGVSLHLTPAGLADPVAPSYPMLGSGSAMMRETLARVHDLGIQVHDIQAFRLTPTVPLSAFIPMLEAGSRLGARYAIVVSDDEDDARNADRLAELGELSVSFGMRVALEFMAYSGIKDILHANRLIDRSGSPHVTIILDALHLVRSGGTASDVMQIDHKRIPYLQICDSHIDPLSEEQGGLRWEARRERLFPGWGKLPLHELVGMLPPELPLSIETPSESLHQAFADSTIARMAIDSTRNLCNQVMVARARRGE